MYSDVNKPAGFVDVLMSSEEFCAPAMKLLTRQSKRLAKITFGFYDASLAMRGREDRTMYRCIPRVLVAIAGSLLVVVCPAQEGATFTSPRAEALRSFTIQQQGLNSAALNLSTSQKAEINKIIAAYVNEQIALEDQLPSTERRSEQASRARSSALASLTIALSKVMNGEQRATWEAARRQSPFPRGDATFTAPAAIVIHPEE
jgi:hypothetical protein